MNSNYNAISSHTKSCLQSKKFQLNLIYYFLVSYIRSKLIRRLESRSGHGMLCWCRNVIWWWRLCCCWVRGEGGERLMLRWSLRAAAGQPAGDSQQWESSNKTVSQWVSAGGGLRLETDNTADCCQISPLFSPLRSGLQSQISLEICPHSFSSVRYGDSS